MMIYQATLSKEVSSKDEESYGHWDVDSQTTISVDKQTGENVFQITSRLLVGYPHLLKKLKNFELVEDRLMFSRMENDRGCPVATYDDAFYIADYTLEFDKIIPLSEVEVETLFLQLKD